MLFNVHQHRQIANTPFYQARPVYKKSAALKETWRRRNERGMLMLTLGKEKWHVPTSARVQTTRAARAASQQQSQQERLTNPERRKPRAAGGRRSNSSVQRRWCSGRRCAKRAHKNASRAALFVDKPSSGCQPRAQAGAAAAARHGSRVVAANKNSGLARELAALLGYRVTEHWARERKRIQLR